MRSLSLYTSLGFDVTASCVVMSGKPRSGPVDGVEVRPLDGGRPRRMRGALQAGPRLRAHGLASRRAPRVPRRSSRERDGRIVAYAAAPTFWPMSHGVAETDEDMQALLLGAAAQGDEPLALLVPLAVGPLPVGPRARVCARVKPMNVMAMGSYQEPRGAWFPSVIY